MIDPEASLSVRRQCELLRLARSALYYTPEATTAEELALMRAIDELHLRSPFYGSRKVAHILSARGEPINRKCVQRLMRLMGLESCAPKPNTSRANKAHPTFPYLLKHLKIHSANQVWATDITYIPMSFGFGYLVAIMDLHSRLVLSWKLSNTMDSSFCVEALQEALSRFPQPVIFNSDQGAQFTDKRFTDELLKRGIKVSMDGKGRYLDNIFVERLWRTLKYEEVYLHAYDNLGEARKGIARHFRSYNTERPHQALGYQTPHAFYCGCVRVAA